MNKDPFQVDTDKQPSQECCGHQGCCPPQEEEVCQEHTIEDENLQPSDVTTVGLLQTQVQQLQRSADEYKDKYLRILAEMENMRKRTQKEKQDLSKFATESVVIDLLTPFDHFETALKYADQMSDEVKNWAMGFNMILTQFKDVLAAQEVRAFDSVGHPFNPHMHEAVEILETDDHSEGTVVKEYTKGYKMGERIIRPARVQVAKPAATPLDEASLS